MEIKTTQEIIGRMTRPNEKNIRWVAVDDLIERVEWLKQKINRTNCDEDTALILVDVFEKIDEAFGDINKEFKPYRGRDAQK